MSTYSNDSGLMLEVKHVGHEHWAKLKNSQPYDRNRKVSEADQLKQLEDVRDGWMSNGPKKYFNAQYRIGQYQTIDGRYVWVDVKHLTTA